MSNRKTQPKPEQAEEIYQIAEAQAAKDRELLASLPKPEPKPAATLADNYFSAVGLIAQAKRETRLGETALVRLWELTLMWALNNRNTPQPNYLPDDLPIDEIITGEAE